MDELALQRCFEAVGRNQSELARRLGTSQQRICKLLKKPRPVPPDLVLPIERAFGISRHEQRPDLYPPVEGRRQNGAMLEASP